MPNKIENMQDLLDTICILLSFDSVIGVIWGGQFSTGFDIDRGDEFLGSSEVDQLMEVDGCITDEIW